MSAVSLGGEIEEQTLGEVLFVFDEGDEWRWVHNCVFASNSL
jgi:hypothetical protein